MSLLSIPLLLDRLDHFLLMKFLNDMVAGLLVTGQDLRPNKHLDFLLWDVIDRVPQLSVGFLSLIRVLEINRTLFGH